MTSLASFEDIYEAAYGREPFPWQHRLVQEVLAQGWPAILDLPTGVGKTSALDVALYCLAAAPERMPRRTVLVVDRRIVVDQGAQHARALLAKLSSATSAPLAGFADRLRALWGAEHGPPFAVAVMRGGMPRDNDWARRPDQPLLGISTVDQLGSRLLFRGYGVSPWSAPIHAGLVGNDTLILLDEVHLANAFANTLDQMRAAFRNAATELPARFAVTQMSATARSTIGPRVFGLDDDDRAHPVLARRMAASKRAALRVVKVTGDDEATKLAAVASHAVQEAIALQAAGARTVAIVVNRVDTARLAHDQLAARLRGGPPPSDGAPGACTLLVTGRMRPIDRDHLISTQLVPRAGAARIRDAGDVPIVVVATQCIEAGADLDFDGIVTECASLDALRQRFGRVDRRGDRGHSESVILARSDQIAAGVTDPVYGAALGATWRWLVEGHPSSSVDFGILALAPPVDDGQLPVAELLPPVAEVPILLPIHLDLWAQTSQQPAADPDVALWLHGVQRAASDVQVIWRADVSLATDDAETLERLQACRPSALEAVTVPLAAARRWLQGEPSAPVADVEVEASEGDLEDRSRGRRGAAVGPAAIRWRGNKIDPIRAADLRPGDVVIVEAARGGLRDSSFAPTSTEPVIDVGDLAQLRGRGIATLRLTREALAVWRFPSAMLETIPTAVADEPQDELDERIDSWLAAWPEQPGPEFPGTPVEWSIARAALQAGRRTSFAGGLIVTARTQIPADVDDAVTEDDDSSFRRVAVPLATHSADVRELAARYARALGFSDALVSDLALAAWLHDVGKADPRFQRWLVGGAEISDGAPGELLAKSALPPGSPAERRLARERAGYPSGARHELLSLALVQGHEAILREARDRDLVLHLVASHHGWCRPFAPPVREPDDFDVHIRHGEHELGARTRHELARLDSDVAPRFWRLVRRHGWWGLAWLEAVLRLADHRASERAQGGAA